MQRIVAWVPEGQPTLKAYTQISLAIGAVVGSLAGGWFAVWLGTRRSYFAMSLMSLGLSAWLFRGLTPQDELFLPVVFALSLASTLYYGWLPYFLPALFPRRCADGIGRLVQFRTHLLRRRCVRHGIAQPDVRWRCGSDGGSPA